MDVVNAGKNSSKGRIVTAVYLQRLLSLLGWGLHLEGCVVCGSKKDIVGLDLSAGGFICRRHINESTTTLLPAVELHAIRQISLISFAELEHVSIDNKVMVAIIKLLGSHYENMTDQQLKSVQLFIN
jgi:DNA repair protein RecO